MMMTNKDWMKFSVVQFIDIPFEGIDNYVCVPSSWILIGGMTDRIVVVLYPNCEDPNSPTRHMVERMESYNATWRSYMAVVKYESNYYRDADRWILTRPDGPLAVEDSKTKDTVSTLNKKVHIATKHSKPEKIKPESTANSSEFFWYTKTPVKRPAQLDSKKQHAEKKLKLDRDNYVNMKPEFSKTEQPLIFQNNQAFGTHIQFRDPTPDSKAVYQKMTQPTQHRASSSHQQPHSVRVPSIQQNSSPHQTNNVSQSITQKATLEDIHRSQGSAQQRLNHTAKRPADTVASIYNSGRRSYTVPSSTTALQNITTVPKRVNHYSHTNEQLIEYSDTNNSGKEKDFLTYYEAASDSEGGRVDFGLIPDQEWSTKKALAIGTNDVNCNHVSPKSNSGDILTDVQNSTIINQQAQLIFNLEKLVLDGFYTVFTQLETILKVQDLIPEAGETYRNLLDEADILNKSLVNSRSNVSVFKSALPLDTEERQAEVTQKEYSGNDNQKSDIVGNEPPIRKHNDKCQLVLPPDYKPNDTRWTLRYQKKQEGLVELMPQTNIYVKNIHLEMSLESKDCRSLARFLLDKIFKRSALKVCSSPVEKNDGPNVRPELDRDACATLLGFVEEHSRKRLDEIKRAHLTAQERHWKVDPERILRGIHSMIQKIRYSK